jgi:hypothetical protein
VGNQIPTAILLAANRDHGTRGRVRISDTKKRVAILCDEEVVGFYTPHMAACGRMRIGPVFVLPEFRRRGLVRAVYDSITGPMMACVEDGNEASRILHEASGFVRWRRYSHGWYYRRARQEDGQ